MAERVSIGIRMHSGWGILVAIGEAAELLERRRVTIVDEDATGGKMPFHHAENMALASASKFLEGYTARCASMATAAVAQFIADLGAQKRKIAAAGIVLASGKALPALENILASHALIHTAEGELFRNCMRRACEVHGISVFGYPERDLFELATAGLGSGAVAQIANAGKKLGPPWTADHKNAALAASLALREVKRGAARATAG
ncbi:MAG: hypothetical protein JOZ10_07045 [Acidobacteria bacterium]|nr:hypothetical protein [Acidobacteriota bacterium]